MLFNMQGLQSYLRRSWCSQASRCEKHFACHLTLSLITTGKVCNVPSMVLRSPHVFTCLHDSTRTPRDASSHDTQNTHWAQRHDTSSLSSWGEAEPGFNSRPTARRSRREWQTRKRRARGLKCLVFSHRGMKDPSQQLLLSRAAGPFIPALTSEWVQPAARSQKALPPSRSEKEEGALNCVCAKESSRWL